MSNKPKFNWDYFLGSVLVTITFLGTGISIGLHIAGK